MGRPLDQLAGLTARDLTHRHITTLPATTTVGELRRYFDASTSHRLALFVDGRRYVGSLTPGDLPPAPDDALAATFAAREPFVLTHEPAEVGRDRALGHPSRRVPVVDERGDLAGIIAINGRLDGFCGV